MMLWTSVVLFMALFSHIVLAVKKQVMTSTMTKSRITNSRRLHDMDSFSWCHSWKKERERNKKTSQNKSINNLTRDETFCSVCLSPEFLFVFLLEAKVPSLTSILSSCSLHHLFPLENLFFSWQSVNFCRNFGRKEYQATWHLTSLPCHRMDTLYASCFCVASYCWSCHLLVLLNGDVVVTVDDQGQEEKLQFGLISNSMCRSFFDPWITLCIDSLVYFNLEFIPSSVCITEAWRCILVKNCKCHSFWKALVSCKRVSLLLVTNKWQTPKTLRYPRKYWEKSLKEVESKSEYLRIFRLTSLDFFDVSLPLPCFLSILGQVSFLLSSFQGIRASLSPLVIYSLYPFMAHNIFLFQMFASIFQTSDFSRVTPRKEVGLKSPSTTSLESLKRFSFFFSCRQEQECARKMKKCSPSYKHSNIGSQGRRTRIFLLSDWIWGSVLASSCSSLFLVLIHLMPSVGHSSFFSFSCSSSFLFQDLKLLPLRSVPLSWW